ncbi:MAG: aspartate aminotransferase family protein [Epsilonproteobacteria bacterium]|nr:aspartate aminotransferase family protein [Campylobacterota bacterium]
MSKKYLMNTYQRLPVSFVKGDGYKLTCSDGNTYIDFLAGIAVNNLGYSNNRMLESIRKASEKPIHVSNLYMIEEQARLAQKYIENSCLDKAFFGNSGAEANEAAIKLARKYSEDHYGHNRYKIVTLEGSFHGRTMATITATGQKRFHNYFNPFLDGFIYAEPDNFEKTISIIDDSIAAVMVELVQGEGGIRPLSKVYVEKLYQYCRKNNIIFVVDEIQTGMGRTGKLFAYQHYNIEPDIITIAKAAGGGLPIGVMLAKEKYAESFTPGTHASTFGGSPFVCSVAYSFFDELISGGYLKNAEIMGNYLTDRLNDLRERFKKKILDVRGLGLLIGIEMAGTLASEFYQFAFNHRLLIGTAGNNVVRFEPPLIIDKAAVDFVITLLERFLSGKD